MTNHKSAFGILLLFIINLGLFAQTGFTRLSTDLLNPDSKKVFVVAHRGDWRNAPENSIEAIEGCIQMGVDIVEIDIAKTKDGHLVLMHDKKIDRTTNETGLVSDFTLEEIKELYLKNGLGRVSEYKIPTLEEAMLISKDRIIVNLDKADQYFDDVYDILKRTGTIHQVIIKSDRPYAELRDKYGKDLEQMTFMPVINLDKDFSEKAINKLLDKKYPFYELVFEEEDKELLLHIKRKLQNTSSVIWINSLWPSLCGGYSDDRAVKNPDKTWGYLIDELGAGILQTDRPEQMLDYLRKRGQHD